MKSLTKTLTVLLILLAGGFPLFGQNTLLINNIETLPDHSTETRNEILLTAELRANTCLFYMEEKLQLEDWMIQPFSTAPQETWEFLVVPREEPLQVRKWMICCADWNLETRQASGLTSPVITLE